jgi:hypothetical protein
MRYLRSDRDGKRQVVMLCRHHPVVILQRGHSTDLRRLLAFDWRKGADTPLPLQGP